ncbi:uncharacterized protein LOC133286801 [Gastrolobium bilobum]|uniref:uncharacterized protein LOC133286801 n=1 Tax=Gastrolobium bilobum TaxID=150636 RepID=UPI002AB0864F|nr:uncharacterized protein LOC133286801 [Gastrolobium bilobum]
MPDKSLHTGKSYGFCNGVFCLYGYYGYSGRGRFILWNPATREVKFIPLPPHNPFELEESGLLHGFGVDLNTNDFKLVKSNIDLDNQLHPVSSAQVYNLSTNSWTLIHDVTLPPIKQVCLGHETHNALSNGIYHWLIGYDDGGFAYILCFDFRTNKFSKLRGPIAAINDGLFMRDYVAEIDGSIAYVALYDNPKLLTIWVMNQHGWAKKHTIWRPDPRDSYLLHFEGWFSIHRRKAQKTADTI